jgi:hypothetical protein
VWSINRSLQRFLPAYSSRAVNAAYLALWQRACVGYLGVQPLLRQRGGAAPTGLAIDEAVTHHLERAAWADASPARGQTLPRGVEALRIGRRARRRSGRVYRRVESGWGDLYLDGALPAFFRPGF